MNFYKSKEDELNNHLNEDKVIEADKKVFELQVISNEESVDSDDAIVESPIQHLDLSDNPYISHQQPAPK